MKKYGLPSNIVSIEPIRQIYKMEKSDVIKLCPRLKKNVLNPSHFEKINVSLSVALINHHVSVAIYYYIINNKLNPAHRTTACFLSQLKKWFKLMTARYHKFALDPSNEEKYVEATIFLRSLQEFFYNIVVNGNWKPFQTRLILSTQMLWIFKKCISKNTILNMLNAVKVSAGSNRKFVFND